MQAAFFRRAQLAAGACLGALVWLSGQAHAQQATPFKPERFDETWPQDAGAPFGAEFKNLSVAPDVTISFGGDGRWRFAALDAPRLGLGGAEADDWLLQRLLLHADLRFDDDARLFVQVGAHDGVSREIPSSTDDDGIDLQQAFLDLNRAFGDVRATLRLGRQELSLGPRFVTTRDSGNVRQRHDMARLIMSAGPWRADLFGGRPTDVVHGAFDDKADLDEEFYGARLQRTFAHMTADFSIYELDRDGVTLAGVTARDERVSLDGRVAGRSGAYDFDAEAVFQGGSFGPQGVRAFGAVLEVARRLDRAPFSPRIGARITYGGGDSDPADGEQGTFAPAFANGAWFGQNGLASFSNTVELAPVLTLAPREDVSVVAKVAGVWRADAADYLYAGNTPLAGTAGGEAYVGVAASVSANWRPSPNLTINPYLSYVAIGDALQSRGAHDVAYAHLTLSLRF